MKRAADPEQVSRSVSPKSQQTSVEEPSRALLDIAIRAVGHGAKIAVAVQKRYCNSSDAGSIEKDDTSPVTVADFAVQCLVTEYLLRSTGDGASLRLVAEEDAKVFEENPDKAEITEVASLLNKSFPFHEFCDLPGRTFSEEDVLALLRRGSDPGGCKGSFWVLDPIDGTMGFIRGAQYAIGLGLIQDGKPILGAMACPNLPPPDGDVERRAEGAGFIFCGHASGAGFIELAAFYSRVSSGKPGSIDWPMLLTPLQVMPSSPQDPLILCESYEKKHRDGDAIRPRLDIFQKSRTLRLDSMSKYALVARGSAHVYLRGSLTPGRAEKIWDHAAAVPILLAAGGQVTDLKGEALDFGLGRTLCANQGVLATNGAVHNEIVNAIAKLGGDSEKQSQ